MATPLTLVLSRPQQSLSASTINGATGLSSRHHGVAIGRCEPAIQQSAPGSRGDMLAKSVERILIAEMLPLDLEVRNCFNASVCKSTIY